MKKQGTTLEKDGKIWSRHTFWDDDEVEEIISQAYPYDACFDPTTPYGDAQPPTVVIQWKEDGEAGVVYPPEYTTTEFAVLSWIK